MVVSENMVIFAESLTGGMKWRYNVITKELQ